MSWTDDIDYLWNTDFPSPLFRAPDAMSEALCATVFKRKVDNTIKQVVDLQRSVLLYADRWVGHRLAASIAQRVNDQGVRIVRCGGLDSGPIEDWDQAMYPAAQLGLMVQREIGTQRERGTGQSGSVYLVENFDMLYAASFHEFDFSFVAHMQSGRRFIFIVESDFTFPLHMEKHFTKIRADRIESPAYLLPLLTADQFIRLVGNPGGTGTGSNTDFLNACKSHLEQEPEPQKKLEYLYLRLAELSPKDIASILDQNNPFSLDGVDAARKKLLSQRLGLTATTGAEAVKTSPWLKDDAENIRALLDYNNKNLRDPYKRVRGLILYGPPGNGKTKLIESICTAGLEWNVISVSSADIKHSLQGESEKAIASLFRRAAQAAPCVLVFDEMEELFRSRSSTAVSDSQGAHGIVTALLREMDGLGRRDGIFVIGLTNQLESVDSAFLRNGRFEDAYLIDAPRGDHAAQAVDFFFDRFYGEKSRIAARDALKAFVKSNNTEQAPYPLSVADIDHLVKHLEVRNIGDNGVGAFASEEWRHLKEMRGIQTEELKQRSDTDNTI